MPGLEPLHASKDSFPVRFAGIPIAPRALVEPLLQIGCLLHRAEDSRDGRVRLAVDARLLEACNRDVLHRWDRTSPCIALTWESVPVPGDAAKTATGADVAIGHYVSGLGGDNGSVEAV